jgi:hypothetical protein
LKTDDSADPLTLEHAMATILAIDLGKFNSVFCWYDSLTKIARYSTMPTKPEEIRKSWGTNSGRSTRLPRLPHRHRPKLTQSNMDEIFDNPTRFNCLKKLSGRFEDGVCA